MDNLKELGKLIALCGVCFKEIREHDEKYMCEVCGLSFCSFECMDRHVCDDGYLPELEMPWAEDEETEEW